VAAAPTPGVPNPIAGGSVYAKPVLVIATVLTAFKFPKDVVIAIALPNDVVTPAGEASTVTAGSLVYPDPSSFNIICCIAPIKPKVSTDALAVDPIPAKDTVVIYPSSLNLLSI